MESIGVRELRQHASRWLARVEAGESFRITDRGRPVATLAPISLSGWDALVASGAVTPAAADWPPPAPRPADSATGRTLSDVLAEDRDDSR